MSAKSNESAIRELKDTVLILQNKVTSLEKLIIEQNNMLKVLIGNSDKQLSASNLCVSEGKPLEMKNLRPMRAARLRAVSASAAKTSTAAIARQSKVQARQPLLLTPLTVPADGSGATGCSAPTTSHSAPSTPCPAVTSETVEGGSPNNSNVNLDDWKEVNRKKSRRSIANITRGTADPGLSTLCAAERKTYLHLYYVKLGTTTDQVNKHLRTICPNDVCTVEALKPRGDYASFKLSVPAKNTQVYLSPEHWAEDVYIKPWRSGFRKPTQHTEK